VLPAAEALSLVRDLNDELVAVCASHPTRFATLVGLPSADVNLSVVEPERAWTTPWQRGAIIPSHYFIRIATMRGLHPVLEAASRNGSHRMIHHRVAGSTRDQMAFATLGAERIMLGTDYPIFATHTATEALAAGRINNAARITIATGHATALPAHERP
jgi:predicted TIM-barrel fold metal-dependent hydrolase